jgi:hypothetical protein
MRFVVCADLKTIILIIIGSAIIGAVKLGTTMYGGALYRQRGSAGQDFATFDGMSQGSTNGLSAIVKQLLGINRAVVA